MPPVWVRGARWAAVFVILLALLDPGLERGVPRPLQVAVVSSGASPPLAPDSLLSRLAAAPSPGFRGVVGADPGAELTLLLGSRLPSEPPAGPIWILATPPAADPAPGLRIHLAGRVLPDRPLPLVLEGGPAGAPVEILARPSGMPDGDWPPAEGGIDTPRAGTLLVRGNLSASGGAVFRVPLPPDPGQPVPGATPDRSDGVLHLTVRVSDRDWVDLALSGRSDPLQLLFHESTPAWGSTLLRRALAADPALRIHARTRLAPQVETTVGDPPVGPLDSPGPLDAMEVLVIPMVEPVQAAERRGIRRWVEERGGMLVLLVEEDLAAFASWEELHGASALAFRRASEPVELRGDQAEGGGGPTIPLLRARVRAVPGELPAGARVHVHDDGAPVVWERAFGEGRVVVVGAVDAWVYRDPQASDWLRFWKDLLDEGGREVPIWPEVSAWRGGPGPGGVVRPGTPVHLELRARPDTGLGPGSGPFAAGSTGATGAGDGAAGAASIPSTGEPGTGGGLTARLHPDGPTLPLLPGPRRGTADLSFLAPLEPGLWFLELLDPRTGSRRQFPLVVDPGAPDLPADPPDLLAAWAESLGGRFVPSTELDGVVQALRETVASPLDPAPWHPFRHPAWILVLLTLLAVDWGWRRRNGYR